MLEIDDKIPMRWWDNELNFGDLLGPWLVGRMTGREVVWAQITQPHYMVVGSILGRVRPTTVAWGIGSFGSEERGKLSRSTRYLAVRGPLTRSKLEMHHISCPPIYGDPALLVPEYYAPDVQKKHEVGVVLRWSEHKRKMDMENRGVKVIDLLTDNIEGVIDDIVSCKRIVTTSLHGLIIADAYGIPNAWVIAHTGSGKEYKYWDYLISVGKVRKPAEYDLSSDDMDTDEIIKDLNFDSRPITIDLSALRASCPFLFRTDTIPRAEDAAREGAHQHLWKLKHAYGRTRRRLKTLLKTGKL